MNKLSFSVLTCIAAIIICTATLPKTAVGQVKAPDGFEVKPIYEVPDEQGSWVCMTTDDKGRLIASDQYGKLYRVTLADGKVEKVEPIDLPIGGAQGLLYAFDSLYVMCHKNEQQPVDGLYRLTDTDGDDMFDKVDLLRKVGGRGGEHGPHAIILSPDKKSIYVCAGNHTKLTKLASSRLPEVWDEDQLLPRMWDAGGHAVGKLAPGGWIAKTDPEGKSFELISAGYRNEYDMAFAPDGELFTYDADMEWDVGAPWYRPTRICHAVSGSEFGWRSGTGKWPTYYPDSLPPVMDIGAGSPTGVTFGTGTKFPAKYQNTFFIADWSFGIIYAVDLKPDGATFSGEAKIFCTAPGLAVTDMTVNAADGSIYFLTGGRKSKSALYRITYSGDEDTAPASYPQPNKLCLLRRSIEKMHVRSDNPEAVVEKMWPYLSHEDRFIRYAARIAIEHQPWESWIDKVASTSNKGTDPQTVLEIVMAAARHADATHESELLAALGTLEFDSLSPQQQLHLLRDYGLVMIRMGASEEAKEQVSEKFASLYPATSKELNIELSRLMIAAEDADAATETMQLLSTAETQEEQIHYVLSLRTLKTGWTPELREQYFSWFLDSGKFKGGYSFARFMGNIRTEAIELLSAQEKESMKTLLESSIEPEDPYKDLSARPIVKKWTLDELLPIEDAELKERDLINGKKMFAVGQCYKCHRIEGQGGIVGPDLTAAGRRFGPHDLLETLINPDKEVSDQYQATIFVMEDGQTIVGRVANRKSDAYMVQTNMLDPGKFTKVILDEIEDSKPAKVSMMPSGLLDTMTQEEILDLMAYMRSVGEVK